MLSLPFQIGGFAGNVTSIGSLAQCSSSVRLSIQDPGSWIGAFIGGAYGSSCRGCTVDRAAAGNWEFIDVIDYQDATPQSMADYDIRTI